MAKIVFSSYLILCILDFFSCDIVSILMNLNKIICYVCTLSHFKVRKATDFQSVFPNGYFISGF